MTTETWYLVRDTSGLRRDRCANAPSGGGETRWWKQKGDTSALRTPIVFLFLFLIPGRMGTNKASHNSTYQIHVFQFNIVLTHPPFVVPHSLGIPAPVPPYRYLSGFSCQQSSLLFSSPVFNSQPCTVIQTPLPIA